MAAVSGPQHVGALTPSHLAGITLGEHLIQESQEHHAAASSKQELPLDGIPGSQAQEQKNSLQENGYPMAPGQPSSDQSNQRPDSAEVKSTRPLSLSQGGLLQPSRVNALQRNSSDVSRGGSEPDSLLDLYGYNPGYRSNVGSVYHVDGEAVNGDFYLDDDDPENSRWIHRDKLARIEIQEMQQAGIKIGANNSPSDFKWPKGRDRSTEHDRTAMMEIGNGQLPPDRSQPGVSAAPAGVAREEPISFELRHPDEVEGNADQPSTKSDQEAPSVPQAKEPGSPKKGLGRRLSHSKIPVATTSPIPIPQGYIEGHPPSHRHASGPWGSFDGDGTMYKKVRNRSNSVGSQILLDDQGQGGTGTPTPGLRSASTPKESPAGIKVAPKPASGLQGPRIVSRDASAQPKPRSRSGQIRNSPNQRPGTRSGESPAGTPVKRPEGDPPWLATMFKPDPRLPPEQQLLPTVAKRLQQEQWEREGKAGSVYDRDFNPVSIHEAESPNAKLQEPDVPEKKVSEKEAEPEWPLRSQRSFTSGGDPAINGTEHGGYKVIPNVEPTGNVTPSPVPPAVPSLQVQTSEDEKGKKALCGCCVVM